MVLILTDDIRGVWNGFRIPILGYPILCIQTIPGFILTVVALILLDIIVSALVSIKARQRNDKDRHSYSKGFALCGALNLGNWLLYSKDKCGDSKVKSERKRRNE